MIHHERRRPRHSRLECDSPRINRSQCQSILAQNGAVDTGKTLLVPTPPANQLRGKEIKSSIPKAACAKASCGVLRTSSSAHAQGSQRRGCRCATCPDIAPQCRYTRARTLLRFVSLAANASALSSRDRMPTDSDCAVLRPNRLALHALEMPNGLTTSSFHARIGRISTFDRRPKLARERFSNAGRVQVEEVEGRQVQCEHPLARSHIERVVKQREWR